MNPIWSYVLTAIGVTGLFIAAKRPRIGWWFNICAQFVWAAYAISTKQWGFLASCFAYGFVYVRLLVHAMRKKTNEVH